MSATDLHLSGCPSSYQEDSHHRCQDLPYQAAKRGQAELQQHPQHPWRATPRFCTAVEDDFLRKNPFDFELAKVIINDSVTREAITREQMR